MHLLIHRPLLCVGCALLSEPNAALRGPSRCSWGCAPGRQVTSLKRGAAFAASTGVRRARGSRAAMRLLCVCERVWLRDLWFFGDKTRSAYLSSVRFFVLVVLRARAELRRYKVFVVVFKYCLNRLLIGSNARSAEPEHSTS